jgi:hypothetical protein
MQLLRASRRNSKGAASMTNGAPLKVLEKLAQFDELEVLRKDGTLEQI